MNCASFDLFWLPQECLRSFLAWTFCKFEKYNSRSKTVNHGTKRAFKIARTWRALNFDHFGKFKSCAKRDKINYRGAETHANERTSDIFKLSRDRFFQIYRLAEDRYRFLPAFVYASVAKRAALAESRLTVRDFYILHRAGSRAFAAPVAARRIESRFVPSKRRFVPNLHP